LFLFHTTILFKENKKIGGGDNRLGLLFARNGLSFRGVLKIGFLKVSNWIRLFFFISFGIYSAFFPSNNQLFSLKNAKNPLETS